jgi:hypothetical protein
LSDLRTCGEPVEPYRSCGFRLKLEKELVLSGAGFLEESIIKDRFFDLRRRLLFRRRPDDFLVSNY